MITTPCVIFAGGKSSRMGEDKALLPFGDKPTLIEFQYERLKKIFQTVYISGKDAKKFHFLKEDEKENFIEDIKTQNIYAPTTGFISVFDALHVRFSSRIKEIFVLSVDTPFIAEEEILKLFTHKDEPFDAIIAKTPQGIHPMCGIYKKGLHVSFKKMLQDNEHKLTKLLRDSNTLFIEFEDENNFLNLNHKEEYQKALLRLQQDRKVNE